MTGGVDGGAAHQGLLELEAGARNLRSGAQHAHGLLGHFLMAKAHGHVTLLTVSLLTLGIPVFSAAAAALFIDEPLTSVQVAGMGIVLASLAMVSLATARRSPDLLDRDIEAIEAAPHP